MIQYLDTSALVKLVVEEEGSERVADICMSSEGVACGTLGYVESHAALARRLNPPVLSAGADLVDKIWADLIVVNVTESVIVEAAELASRHRLRGYDAMHLSFAKTLEAGVPGGIGFVCWDKDLDGAAAKEGLHTP